MEEKELKTSPKQRIFIGIIAVIMLGSIVAGYAAIVVANSNNSSTSAAPQEISAEKKAQYQQEYDDAASAYKAATQADFDKFVQYKGEVKAYNETAANGSDVQTTDLVVGDGKQLAEGDTDYLAYYIGWCADESVFDTNMDSSSNPTQFVGALDPSAGLIEGWEIGVVGMNLGGIREITIPGELAYKDQQEICGGTYKPLKFMVMAVPADDNLKKLSDNVNLASTKLQYAQYGIDYDQFVEEMYNAENSQNSGSSE